MVFRALMEEELESWYDHCDACFPKTERSYFVRNYTCDPVRDLANTLVAVDDGLIAASVRIIPRKIYLNGRAVEMGGIGDVSTKAYYRHRGLALRLMKMAIERMNALNLPVSMLFSGANELYQKAGYQSAITERVTLEVPKDALPDGVTARYFTPTDFTAMRGLYDLYAAQFSGAVVRDNTAYWEEWIPKTMRHAHLLEMDGRIQAYIVTDNVREDAEGGATFDATEYIAAPAAKPLLPAFLRAVAEIGHLPTRVRINRPLWPDAPGDVTRSESTMLRLNAPFTLDGRIDSTQALIDAAGPVMFFAADSF